MTERTLLYCLFTDEAQALQVATALRNAALPPDTDFEALPPVETFPPDGWLGGIYYAIDVVFGTGQITAPTGEVDEEGNPIYAVVSGYHINGIWCGPEDTVPVALQPFRVYPETPACVFG